MVSTNFEAVSKAKFCKLRSSAALSLFEHLLQSMSDEFGRAATSGHCLQFGRLIR